MIFGFNTDVKHGETVYHVQSEARQRELRLQTQVFVSGQCIAKRTSSYATAQSRADFSSNEMHDLLRAQHRNVIELVRAGSVHEVGLSAEDPEIGQADAIALDAPVDRTGTPQARAAESAVAPLMLEWLNRSAIDASTANALQFDFLVSEAGAAVADAHIFIKLNGSSGTAQYAQASTGIDGRASVPLALDTAAHGEFVALLVQATCAGRSVTRKFHLRRSA